MERPLQSQAMRGRSFARTYSLSKAARVSGLSVEEIEAAISRGELPVTFIPRRAIDKEAFNTWSSKRFMAEQEAK